MIADTQDLSLIRDLGKTYHAGKALAEAKEARDLFSNPKVPPQILFNIRQQAKLGNMACTIHIQGPMGAAMQLRDSLQALGYRCKTTLDKNGPAVLVAWGEEKEGKAQE